MYCNAVAAVPSWYCTIAGGRRLSGPFYLYSTVMSSSLPTVCHCGHTSGQGYNLVLRSSEGSEGSGGSEGSEGQGIKPVKRKRKTSPRTAKCNVGSTHSTHFHSIRSNTSALLVSFQSGCQIQSDLLCAFIVDIIVGFTRAFQPLTQQPLFQHSAFLGQFLASH